MLPSILSVLAIIMSVHSATPAIDDGEPDVNRTLSVQVTEFRLPHNASEDLTSKDIIRAFESGDAEVLNTLHLRAVEHDECFVSFMQRSPVSATQDSELLEMIDVGVVLNLTLAYDAGLVTGHVSYESSGFAGVPGTHPVSMFRMSTSLSTQPGGANLIAGQSTEGGRYVVLRIGE